ncbi:hypothetical protein [Gelidibacter gilvus]|uniref:Uncharacterized protein n=1 Tax=Gelidibacter gilvus TaxID=59602 RepID=A0A4Q0XIQ2_9FLAO|nr:hypothetical protein [Gelidibacter gilvus]RXJ51514.1 hypothetical protein ESZ48_06520 [Gelidibacter gilvus]
MKKEDKTTPMLDPKIKDEQNIKRQDHSDSQSSKKDASKKPTKDDPKKVPESNDPAGYGESGNIKKSPFKKKD